MLAVLWLGASGLAWGGAGSPALPVTTQRSDSPSSQHHLSVDQAIDGPGKDGNTPLMAAAKKGQINTMKALIAKGAGVNSRNPRGSAPLVFAVDGGIEAVTLLLSKGARVDAQSDNGLTALAWAVHRKRPDIFQRLLAAGANPRLLSSNRQTLLHLAASVGHAGLVRQLLDIGLPPDALDITNETALIKAAENGHVEVVRLLATKSPLSHWSAENETALTLASKEGYREVVRALIDAGGPVTGKEGDRAIANAVEAKQWEITRYLLKQGANVNARGFLGRPLLSLAAWTNQPALAFLLLAHGADPNLKSESESGETPLQMAALWTDSPALIGILLKIGARHDPEVLLNTCGKKSPAKLEVLLAAGVDLAVAGDNKETCLHAAVRSGSVTTVAFVLQQPQGGKQLATRDGYGYTPLMRAASKKGHEFAAVVEQLLAAGSPIDGQDGDGNTVLHLAAEANSAAAIRLLLAKGATQASNRLGKTPIAWAANWGNLDAVLALDQPLQVKVPRPWLPDLVVKLVDSTKDSAALARALEFYGAQIDQPSRSEALYWAVNGNQIEAAKVLLDHGADPNSAKSGVPILQAQSVAMAELLWQRGARLDSPGAAGWTVLIEAAKESNIALMRWLLAHGAKPNHTDQHGWNALDYARSTGLREAIATMEQAGGKSSRPSQVLWAADVTEGQDIDGFTAQPLVAGDQLIVGHENGFLYAFDRKIGHLNWKRSLGGKIGYEVRLLDGDLFVTSASHALYRIHPQDGTIVWHYAYSGGQVASGVWAWRDLALFADFSGTVRAVDRKTGQLRWEKNLGRELASVVTGEDAIRLAGDGLYFLNEGGLNRYDLDTGKTMHFAATKAGMPEIAEGLAFLPSKEKHLYVLDAETLKLRQIVALADQSLLRPLYHDGRLYLSLRDKLLAFPLRQAWLRALSMNPLGSPEWQIEITQDLYARPVWANGRIYSFRPVKPRDKQLADSPLAGFFTQTRLVAIDPKTGQEKSAILHERFSSKLVTPAVTADAVYVLPLNIGQRVLAVKALP